MDIGPFQDIKAVGWGGNDIIFLTLNYQNPWRFEELFTDGFILFGIRFPDNPALNLGQFADNQGTLYSPSDDIPAWSGFSMPSQSFLFYLGPTDEIFAGVMFNEFLDDGNFCFATFFRVPRLPIDQGQVRMQIFAICPFERSFDDPVIDRIQGTVSLEVARRMEDLPLPAAQFVDTEAPFAFNDLVFRWDGGGDLRTFINDGPMPLGSDVLVEVPLGELGSVLPSISCGTCGVLIAEILYNRSTRTAELLPFDTGAGFVDPWG